MTAGSSSLDAQPRSRVDAALDIATEALRQIARDRAEYRPTAYFRAKAQFALDRINELRGERT